MQVFRPEHPLARTDGYVFEHRLVAYEAGWELAPGYDVHHKNSDRSDNRIENLEVLPTAEHTRKHLRAQGYVINQFGTWPLKKVA